MPTIRDARSHAQDALHYAIFALPDHQNKGRESTFVSERGLTNAMARKYAMEKLTLAGITSRTSKPLDMVIAIDAWSDAQGWNAFNDCEA